MAIPVSGNSGLFTIQAPASVTLDSPNSGSYAHNQNISISWTKSGFTQNIDLYWTTGTTFATTNNILINQSGSSFSWNVPSSLAGTSIYIWVRKTSDSTVKDRSDSSISITSASFTQTPSDSANISEDTPTSTTTRWKFVETASDSANISESTPTSSTKPWKYVVGDDANLTEDAPSADTSHQWKFQEEPGDSADISEDTPTSSTKLWKHTPDDEARLSEDTPSANTSHQWKFQEEPDDEARLSEDTPSANTSHQWKFQEEPDDDANITEDTSSTQKLWKHLADDQADLSEAPVGEAQKLWKHLPDEQADLSEAPLGEAQKLWKHLIPETANVSEDAITSAQKIWKHIISETIAITEEEPGDLYLSQPGDFSSFTEDFSAQVLKGLELHKFDPSGTESFGILRKSGWLKASDLNTNSILRKISLRYNSQDPITVNIYADGDEVNPVFTKTAPSQTGEELFNKSFRVGRRAKYFMVELLTGETANYDTTIASLEVKVDG